MKSYPTVKTTPSRKVRKSLRLSVFMANKKATKARKKAERLERKSRQVEE